MRKVVIVVLVTLFLQNPVLFAAKSDSESGGNSKELIEIIEQMQDLMIDMMKIMKDIPRIFDDGEMKEDLDKLISEVKVMKEGIRKIKMNSETGKKEDLKEKKSKKKVSD